MPESEELLQNGLLGLAIFIAALLMIVFSLRASRRQEAKEQLLVDNAISEGVAAGVLNESGHPLCAVCGQVATRYGVVTGRSWFDKIPILSRLNQLYSMPWRYTVEDDYENGYRLCSVHRRAAEHRLEQLHSQMRSDHADFNAKMRQKIAMMDQGGLIALLREDSEEIKRSIGFRGVVRRSVESRQLTHEVHILPPVSKPDVGDV